MSNLIRLTKTVLGSEPAVELGAVKQHLLIRNPSRDSEILAKVRAATRIAEQRLRRVLWPQQQITAWYSAWELSLKLTHPPTQRVTKVEYYDEGNTLKTLAVADYRVSTSTDGVTTVDFDRDYNFPSLYSHRIDRVGVTHIAGYPNRDAIPEEVKQGINLHTQYLVFGTGDRAVANELIDHAGFGFYA